MLSRSVKSTIRTVGILTSTALLTISNANAGSFQLWEQDAATLGNYHAGAAAEGNTAGDEFYNIASVSRLNKSQLSFGGALIAIDLKYHGDVTAIIPRGTVTVSGSTTAIVPNFHYVRPLSDKLTFAFGVTTPFGLETQYPNVAPINFAATKTELITMNFNPGLAYKINRNLSVGAGFDVLYGRAKYEESLNGIGGMTDVKTKLSGTAVGYNLGALYELNQHNRLGISYRSGITVKSTGKTTISGTNDRHDSSAKLALPSTTILSVYHDVNDRLALMASAFYTNWKVFDYLILKNVVLEPETSVYENYKNTWNFAVGGNYRYSDHLAFKVGGAYDQTPTRNEYRDIRLPDNNRWIASAGIDITPKPGFVWSIGYGHIFLPKNTPVDNTKTGSGPTHVVTVGTAKGSINIIGVQLTMDV